MKNIKIDDLQGPRTMTELNKMLTGIICDICKKEKNQVILKMNNKGEIIHVCQNCNKKNGNSN